MKASSRARSPPRASRSLVRSARRAGAGQHCPAARRKGLRELHPDVPVVLTASGIEPDWIETIGCHRVTPLVGAPTGARLAEAIEEAIAKAHAVPGPG